MFYLRAGGLFWHFCEFLALRACGGRGGAGEHGGSPPSSLQLPGQHPAPSLGKAVPQPRQCSSKFCLQTPRSLLTVPPETVCLSQESVLWQFLSSLGPLADLFCLLSFKIVASTCKLVRVNSATYSSGHKNYNQFNVIKSAVLFSLLWWLPTGLR